MLLSGARVAILVEDLFEEIELTSPRDALTAAGAKVVLVGPMAGKVYTGKHGGAVTADLAAGAARVEDFDAVVIPGGYAPDKMRLRHAMVDLVRDSMAAGKPVAAICHGPSVLINAKVLQGKTLTWASLKGLPFRDARAAEEEAKRWLAANLAMQEQALKHQMLQAMQSFSEQTLAACGHARWG